MAAVSKNMYELLGNDPEQDPELRTPDVPTKAVTQPTARLGKRNGPAEAPSASTGAIKGGRGAEQRDKATGNERAFNDRNAGSFENRRRAPDDGVRQDRHPDAIRRSRGEYRGRGRGRGASGGGGLARGSTRPDDRHSKTGLGDHEKQVAHGWGGTTGDAEWADEQAGEAIAKEEEKEGFDTTVPPPVDADGNPLPSEANGEGAAAASEEPEEAKTKGLADYLAEQAEKKLALGGLDIRKPNEGSKQKFPEGKAFARDEEQENFFIGGGEKKTRERTKKEKQTVELDAVAMRPQEASDDRRGGRGGRGRGGPRRDDGERRERREPREPREGGEEGGFRGGRGGRGRGEGGRGRGEGRGRGGAGGPRGGRGGPSGPNVADTSAFPSLGA